MEWFRWSVAVAGGEKGGQVRRAGEGAADQDSEALRGVDLSGEAGGSGLLAEAGGVTESGPGEQQQTMIPSWDRAAHLKRERERLMVQSSLEFLQKYKNANVKS